MTFTPSEHLQTLLKNLPHKPGCYLMKDAAGAILYVGKAKDLHNRVRSYFDSSLSDPKTLRLRAEIAHIDFIVLPDEIAALHTEYHLIRQHQPRFNVRFKDDKKYPYIAVRWAQDFPRVEITRRLEADGSRYFGPYTSASDVRETLDVLRRAFPYLTCDRTITGKDERACLYHDIKLCNAPCVGKVSREEYRATLQGLMDFLSGQSDAIVRRLRAEMNAAAAALDFERAAALRDRLKALERVVARQKVVLPAAVDHDAIAFTQDKDETCVQVLFIRGGRLIGREHFLLVGADETAPAEILRQFVLQFYENAAQLPDEVLLPEAAAEAQLLEQWLRAKSGKKVVLSVPKRGSKAELVRIALENAQETLAMLRAQWASDTHKQTEALAELQRALKLPAPPNRIECFDISTLQGTATVASRVVFVQGTPRKAEYRKFNIKSVTTIGEPNDFQALREALTRRFQRYADALSGELGAAPLGKRGEDETWRRLPDLLIIDGGKGQLGIALEVLKHFHLLGQVPVCALAKQEEELFVPTQAHSILLPRRSQALYLLQRIRDEAHRFAISANRQQRARRGVVSRLESIPGIGAARRKALLKAFDMDIDKIRAASLEELMQVKGISRQLAEQIKAHL